jgi:hypothetical protein
MKQRKRDKEEEKKEKKKKRSEMEGKRQLWRYSKNQSGRAQKCGQLIGCGCLGGDRGEDFWLA